MVSASGGVGVAQGKARPTPQWALLPAMPQCSLPSDPGPHACWCLSVFFLPLNLPPPSFLLSLPHPCFCPLKRPQPPPDSLLCSWPPSRHLFSFPLSGDQEGQSGGYEEGGRGAETRPPGFSVKYEHFWWGNLAFSESIFCFLLCGFRIWGSEPMLASAASCSLCMRMHVCVHSQAHREAHRHRYIWKCTLSQGHTYMLIHNHTCTHLHV